MKNITKGLLASMLLMPAAAFADGLAYTYIQGDYTKVTYSGTSSDIDADGWNASASFLVAPNVFVFGGYSDIKSDDFTTVAPATATLKVKSYDAGLGVRAPITDFMDVNLAASWVHNDNSYDGTLATNSKDGDGYSVALGLRSELGKWLELDTGYVYTDVSDSKSAFNVGGVFHITKNIGINAGYSFGDDVDGWQAGLRLSL